MPAKTTGSTPRRAPRRKGWRSPSCGRATAGRPAQDEREEPAEAGIVAAHLCRRTFAAGGYHHDLSQSPSERRALDGRLECRGGQGLGAGNPGHQRVHGGQAPRADRKLLSYAPSQRLLAAYPGATDAQAKVSIDQLTTDWWGWRMVHWDRLRLWMRSRPWGRDPVPVRQSRRAIAQLVGRG